MSPAGGRRVDEVAHESVDAHRAGRPEQRDLVPRQIAVAQQAEADGVVDVVVDVGDAVDDAHDPPLERLRLLVARVREDAVADLVREVEPSGDDERLLVVAEVPAGVLVQGDCPEPPRPACPNGVWPMSWPRPIASTRSSLSRSARATTREIADVSRVCVMRVR